MAPWTSEEEKTMFMAMLTTRNTDKVMYDRAVELLPGKTDRAVRQYFDKIRKTFEAEHGAYDADENGAPATPKGRKRKSELANNADDEDEEDAKPATAKKAKAKATTKGKGGKKIKVEDKPYRNDDGAEADEDSPVKKTADKKKYSTRGKGAAKKGNAVTDKATESDAEVADSQDVKKEVTKPDFGALKGQDSFSDVDPVGGDGSETPGTEAHDSVEPNGKTGAEMAKNEDSGIEFMSDPPTPGREEGIGGQTKLNAKLAIAQGVAGGAQKVEIAE